MVMTLPIATNASAAALFHCNLPAIRRYARTKKQRMTLSDRTHIEMSSSSTPRSLRFMNTIQSPKRSSITDIASGSLIWPRRIVSGRIRINADNNDSEREIGRCRNHSARIDNVRSKPVCQLHRENIQGFDGEVRQIKGRVVRIGSSPA